MYRTLIAVAILCGIPLAVEAGDGPRREPSVRDLVVLPAQYVYDAARLFDLARLGTAVSWGREATAVLLAAVEEKRAVCEGDKCAVKPGDVKGGELHGARPGACPHCNRDGHGGRRGPPHGAMPGHGRPPHASLHHRGAPPHAGMHHRGAPQHAGMHHGGPSRMGPPHHGGPRGPHQFGPGRHAGPPAFAQRGHHGPMHRGSGRPGFAHHGGREHHGPPHHAARGQHGPSHHGPAHGGGPAHARHGSRGGCEHCRHAQGEHGHPEQGRRELARPGHESRSADRGGDARREMFEKLMRERHEQFRRHAAAMQHHGRDAGPSRREEANKERAKEEPKRDGAKPEGDRKPETAQRPGPQLPWFAQGGMSHPGMHALGRMAPQGEGDRRPEPQGPRVEGERRPNSPEGRGPGANAGPGEHRGPPGPPAGGDHRIAELERKVDSLTKAVEMLAKSLKEKSSK